MSRSTFQRRQAGFTLIEIAIVLVIIGLLLGGILKGQELINSARVKNLASDFRNVPVFIYGYQDKFRSLPGDDSAASTHLNGATNATTPGTTGNGVIEGSWNSTTTTDETYLFWQHVRLAGLAPGSTTAGAADFQPRNAAGGLLGVQSATPYTGISPSTYYVCSSAILGKFVKQLDSQLDNGDTATGAMVAGTAVSSPAGAPTTTANIADATPYVVCMGI